MTPVKPAIGFDTAALVSLGHTKLVQMIIDNFSIILTKGILEELKTIAARNDDDALAAREWLLHREDLVAKESGKRQAQHATAAEEELFDICKNRNIPLVTDDIRATKRFESDVTCLFSVHVVYLLSRKGLISGTRALVSMEKMRKGRDWKGNIIAVTGKVLFE